jgi:hypothetical protein
LVLARLACKACSLVLFLLRKKESTFKKNKKNLNQTKKSKFNKKNLCNY